MMSNPRRAFKDLEGESRIGPLLQRLWAGGREGNQRILADVQRVSRELAALAFNYNAHSMRARIYTPAVQEIDTALDAATVQVSQALFQIQQRLLLDDQVLGRLARLEKVPHVDDTLAALDDYTATLGPILHETRTVVDALALHLSVLANNTEIAAYHAGTASRTPIEVFITLAQHMRSLVQRFTTIAEDLIVFEQTQLGYAEAVRLAAQGGEREDSASTSIPRNEGARYESV